MIRLNEQHIAAITSHAEKDYPNECGGLLLGAFENGDKKVVDTLPMKNTAAVETQHDRVLIDPRDLMLAEREARIRGLDIVGYYHSHPDDEAVPSQFDLDHALPVWSYIIVSVSERKAVDWHSWEMRSDRSRFDKEEFEITRTVSE